MDKSSSQAVVTATDSAITPSTMSVVSNPSVPDVNPLTSDNNAPRIAPRQIVTGKSRGIQQLGGADLYADSNNEQIIAAPGGIPQVLLGKQPTFGQGFYVSQPGIDATKATRPDQFIFNSNQDVFKIVKSGSFTTNFSGAVSTGQIPHGLDFTPLVIASLNQADLSSSISDTDLPLPTWVSVGVDTVNNRINFQRYISAFCDDTNLYALLLDSTGIPITLTVTYYLLQETATQPTPPPPTI